MSFDYSKLRGKIVEKYGSQTEFAKAMQCSERTLSLKLNGNVMWRQDEICRAIEALNLSESDIHDYFFTMKVQDNEL